MVPGTLYLWGMRAFFIVHRSINMLDQVERDMERYFTNNKQLMSPNLPQLVNCPSVTKMKYFILQNATGIVRECLSTTAANAHVVIDEDGSESDDSDDEVYEIIEISSDDD